jgi:hypothetical protein
MNTELKNVLKILQTIAINSFWWSTYSSSLSRRDLYFDLHKKIYGKLMLLVDSTQSVIDGKVNMAGSQFQVNKYQEGVLRQIAEELSHVELDNVILDSILMATIQDLLWFDNRLSLKA